MIFKKYSCVISNTYEMLVHNRLQYHYENDVIMCHTYKKWKVIVSFQTGYMSRSASLAPAGKLSSNYKILICHID